MSANRPDFIRAQQVAGKVDSPTSAAKAANENKVLAASLKRCPDTNREFFRSLPGYLTRPSK
jgi:hypothetical protein